MQIPSILETQIAEGSVILFLGAGVSLSAVDTHGNHPPDGPQLATLLSERFLGGSYQDCALDQVSDYAISEAGLFPVQEFVRRLFESFQPAETHKVIPSFYWYGLATTNYDRVLERAYETCNPQSSQNIQPLTGFKGEHIEDLQRDPDNVLLLKLYGCITRTADQTCPLVLTNEHLLRAVKSRQRLFRCLSDWATEHPILFIGHSLNDNNIRNMMINIAEEIGERPRYFAIVPKVEEIESRFWEEKKLTLIEGTFGEFVQTINGNIPQEQRRPFVSRKPEVNITSGNKQEVRLGRESIGFLNQDVEVVRNIRVSSVVKPAEFYRGANQGWGSIEQELDVRRDLMDQVLLDHFLINESQHLQRAELIAIRAHAGAGKSVFLKRLAWEAANEYDCLCLFLRSAGRLDVSALREIIGLIEQRVYLFIDDTPQRVREVTALLRSIGSEGNKLTVVTAGRINEWNVSCVELTPYLCEDYALEYLSPGEIDELLLLLEKHRALGALSGLNTNDRRAAFEERAGRQLLVALHETTMGRPFEDIIEDEYRNIVPIQAQQIYLSIAVLNRFRIDVRAGIISRLHGVAFVEFKEKFFSPLEHVVFTEWNEALRENMYRTRHPYIAEILFLRILADQEERYTEYIRCLSGLNLEYSIDSNAFQQMIRANSLLEMFSNHELVRSIYKMAYDVTGDDPHLFHQMAIYEMNRPNGNLENAGDLLRRALDIEPNNYAIKHTFAELDLRRAEKARSPLERDRLLNEAGEIARSLRRPSSYNTYGYHIAAKVGIKRLEALLAESTGTDEIPVDRITKEIEDTLSIGLQRFPGSPHLLEAEAQYAEIIEDSPRAIRALEKAFASNPRSGHVAIRLSRYYSGLGDRNRAIETLEKALNARNDNKNLHYEYAKLLQNDETVDPIKLKYHLVHSFSPGDRNFDARILYGRLLFLENDVEEYRKIFQLLRDSAGGRRDAVRYPIDSLFQGTITRKESDYCLITRDGPQDIVLGTKTNISRDVWNSLTRGTRVSFRVGFSYRGANAFDVSRIGSME